MSKVRLAVKRRDNGKHVSKMNLLHHLMVAEVMTQRGINAGLYSLPSLKNFVEPEQLQKVRSTHMVSEVKVRQTDGQLLFCMFDDLAFPVALAEWFRSKPHNPHAIGIEPFSKLLASEQAKIVRGDPARDRALESLFMRYAEPLIRITRKASWWEERFAELRKQNKKARVKNDD